MSSLPTRFRQENAFTIVEVMVAALVLLTGLLGAIGILTGAIRTTATNNERMGATNLLRELIENTRTAPYTELENGRLATALQAMPNMGSGTTPWRVTRRNVVYTITFTACTYDDPADKLAATPATDACTPTPPGTTGDANGDDFRRITFTVSWLDHGRPKSMRQNALIVNPTGGLGPRIIHVAPTVNPVTTGTSAAFTATSTTAQAVHWTTDDGISEGDATGGPTSWNIAWPLGTVGAAGSVVDGTYKLIAQAFDISRSVPGDSKVATVTINRNLPFALTNFIGGQNARLNINEFSWTRSRERDIVGYRIYNAGPDGSRGAGNDTQVCPATAGAWMEPGITSCTAPAAAGSHFIVALDRDTAGAVREGTDLFTTVTGPGSAPSPPQSPSGPAIQPSVEGKAEIRWNPSPSTGLMMYRIYRGTSATLANRIGSVGPTGTAPFSFVDTASPASASYWVTAVNATFNESATFGPLNWTAP